MAIPTDIDVDIPRTLASLAALTNTGTSTSATATATAPSPSDSVSEEQKKHLVDACEKVVEKFRTPERGLIDMFFAPLKPIALRLAIDMRIFDAGVGKEQITLQQLAEETGCEGLLIKRVLRVLIAMALFTEADKDVFAPTPAAAMYVTESPMAQMIIHWTENLPVTTSLPSFFATHGYTSPTDALNCPFQHALNTPLHSFAWTAAEPKRQKAFNAMMTMRTKRSVDSKWFEVYPMTRVLEDDGEGAGHGKEEVFLVDIGGGIGHQTVDFKQHFPGVKARCVVQDIAAVIDAIPADSLPEGVEAAVYDFFAPQPVHNARIYLLAHVLHDWPDAQAAQILGRVRDAMGSESVVLLSETIMPGK
ncbi:S-adenosyl-L-methionine-dependent methyltransferase [Byssothecium circinans]|uniref:S-adenosyl-L-methionine-dependent methyltransferase n=1 Tax=Byssothecium circinans TaxID=147558 RepID=A0A6A5UKT3_9PLEO|nr:S-adenosyl-L-methionine-dependent methyltransferase [Byssothecium circinans]